MVLPRGIITRFIKNANLFEGFPAFRAVVEVVDDRVPAVRAVVDVGRVVLRVSKEEVLDAAAEAAVRVIVRPARLEAVLLRDVDVSSPLHGAADLGVQLEDFAVRQLDVVALVPLDSRDEEQQELREGHEDRHVHGSPEVGKVDEFFVVKGVLPVVDTDHQEHGQSSLSSIRNSL